MQRQLVHVVIVLVIFSILLIQSSPLSIYVNFTSNQLRIQNYLI